MAIIKPNNNTISAITALPAAIPTGKVLQVVSATQTTSVSTTSSSYITTNLSASITPSATSDLAPIKQLFSIITGDACNGSKTPPMPAPPEI